MARKTQAISGLTMAYARRELSDRSARIARERKMLTKHSEEVQLAMDMLKSVVKKAGKNAYAWGSINADAYYSNPAEQRIEVRATCNMRALSLDSIEFKKAYGYAKLAGFVFENDAEKIATSWSAGLRAKGVKKINETVSAYILLELELKGEEEGATCRRVQVGTTTKVVEEAVYELRCD